MKAPKFADLAGPEELTEAIRLLADVGRTLADLQAVGPDVLELRLEQYRYAADLAQWISRAASALHAATDAELDPPQPRRATP